MSSDSKLRVIIIGSGLAGLAAARVLREHCDVAVYERGGPETATGGQGITTFSPAVKILETLGFDRDRAGSVPSSGYRIYDKEGRMVSDIDVDFKDRYGADTLTHKRSDFRDELMRLATSSSNDLSIGGDPANMVFHTTAIDLDPKQGAVTFSDGSKVSADVVIGKYPEEMKRLADGIHSKLRSHVVGSEDHQPVKVGLSCFRVAVSAEQAKKTLGELPKWWDPTTGSGRGVIFESADGTNRFVTTYPLRSFDYMNISCVFPSRHEHAGLAESWHADGNRTEMLEIFSDYPEDILKLLSVATEVKSWDLQDLDPLPTWTNGRAILVGDAAHAMTPLQGQGANMAVEDAGSLRLLLRPGVTTKNVEEVLREIEGIRKPRATQILHDTRSLSRDVSYEERLSRMDYNCRYEAASSFDHST